ncbi:MAG: hypothetical protein HQ582_06705 [Planctomycetes bacterium]|nr:hypothetical protein [Planctomycetota bacterium]
MTHKPPNAAPTFVITLKPAPDTSDPKGTRRLRRLLKYALRVCRLKCIRVKEVER